jgi:hypothetical protein
MRYKVNKQLFGKRGWNALLRTIYIFGLPSII